MDADLNDPAWGELGELFSKDSSSSAAIDAFQVQLNGELVVPDADLPLPTVSLPEHPVRLDAALNPVQVSGDGEPVSPPTAMDVDDEAKQAELVAAVTASPEPAPAAAIVKPEPAPVVISPVSSAAPAAAASTSANSPSTPPVAAVKAEPSVAAASAASAALSRPAEGRVEKRPIGSLKEKREREAKQFPRNLLSNLEGTTSAEVRKMSAKERELVLYKRKLRNRESARRSRQKRQATLAELQEEIGDLLLVAGRMVDAGLALRAENGSLREKLDLAQAEIRALRAVYPSAAAAPAASAASAASDASVEASVEADAAAATTAVVGAVEADAVPAKAVVPAAKSGAEEDIPLKMKMGG